MSPSPRALFKLATGAQPPRRRLSPSQSGVGHSCVLFIIIMALRRAAMGVPESTDKAKLTFKQTSRVGRAQQGAGASLLRNLACCSCRECCCVISERSEAAKNKASRLLGACV